MMPLASVDDLGVRLGLNLSGVEQARALAALDDASALIRSEAGEDWDGEPIPPVIVSIALQVAFRAYRNPDGVTQTSVGDVSVSYTRDGVAGQVWLTDAERRQIRKAAGKPGFLSVPLATPYMQDDD